MSDVVAINLLSTATLSTEVFKANISKGAKQLYWLFCILPNTENNEIKLPQKVLAQELGVSVSSIGRYLKELVTEKFVKFLEAQKPGEVRSLQLENKIETPKKIEEPKRESPKVEIPARSLTLNPSPPRGEGRMVERPFVQTKPFSSHVLPIDEPREECTIKLDAMGEAVLEQALKEQIPPGKDMPKSIDDYCEQYLYLVKPKGFFNLAYIIRERYNKESKKRDLASS